MNYIETNIHFEPASEENFDILTALLGEIGYESFSQSESNLLAYILEQDYSESELNTLIESIKNIFTEINYQSNKIADKNWNEEWEKNFDPIFIDDICLIKAPFHEIDSKSKHTIIIEPKMSFGTGHHSTTSSMIKLMANCNFNDQEVLDMGCGTGVLAIFAAQKGAKKILAIDIDSWAYENTLENLERNKIRNTEVQQGDVKLLKQKTFHTILANINRNILLNDMQAYVNALKPNGQLLLSGFYTEDLPIIKEKATELNLTYSHHLTDNNWVAALFNL